MTDQQKMTWGGLIKGIGYVITFWVCIWIAFTLLHNYWEKSQRSIIGRETIDCSQDCWTPCAKYNKQYGGTGYPGDIEDVRMGFTCEKKLSQTNNQCDAICYSK